MKIQKINQQNYIKNTGNIKTKIDRGPIDKVSLGNTEETPDFLKLGKIRGQAASIDLDNCGRTVSGLMVGAMAAGVAALSGASPAATAAFGIGAGAAGALFNDKGFTLGAVLGCGIAGGIAVCAGTPAPSALLMSGLMGGAAGIGGIHINSNL